MIKIMMFPNVTNFGNGESGIHTVIRKAQKHFPKYDMEIVNDFADSFDVLAIHAGTSGDYGNGPMVAHCHGLYWTGDIDCAQWEYKANRDVIRTVRNADIVTVPSDWVSRTFQREMRINPVVLGHGVDWEEWQGQSEHSGYILWNKNRSADVCDPKWVRELATIFGDINFLSTFAPENSPS